MPIKNFFRRTLSASLSFLRSLTYSPVRYAVAAIGVYFVNVFFWKIPVGPYEPNFPVLLLLLLVGFIIVIFMAFRSYRQQREETAVAESKHISCESPAIKSLVVSLRRRALGLRVASWFILGLTFSSISAGLYIFTSAGDIARSEIFSNQINELKSLREKSINDQVHSLGEVMKELNEQNKRDDQKNKQLAIKELQKITHSVEDIIRIADSDSKDIKELIQRIEQTSGSNERLLYFLSTMSTRIGSILLLIFLVQILLSVYRYSVRLVSYYEARADALLLYGGSDAGQLQMFVATLSAEKVEFGKSLSSPTEQAVELLKTANELRK